MAGCSARPSLIDGNVLSDRSQTPTVHSVELLCRSPCTADSDLRSPGGAQGSDPFGTARLRRSGRTVGGKEMPWTRPDRRGDESGCCVHFVASELIWIVVRGEVDLSNRQQLRTGLAAIDLGKAILVYLDLRPLRFATAWAVASWSASKQAAAAGHDGRIHRAPPIVPKVMSIVSDRTPSHPADGPLFE